jgi:hypothetical protein
MTRLEALPEVRRELALPEPRAGEGPAHLAVA